MDQHIIPLAKLSTSTLTHVLGVQEVSGLRSEERVYGAHAAVAAANARKRAAAESSGSAAPVGGGGDAPKRWAPRGPHQILRCGFACGDLVLLAMRKDVRALQRATGLLWTFATCAACHTPPMTGRYCANGDIGRRPKCIVMACAEGFAGVGCRGHDDGTYTSLAF